MTDPAGLATATLAQICRLVTDGTHDTPRRVTTGFPLIKAKEIVGGRIDFETCDEISEEDHLEVISRSKPERGDTLFAHIGASLGEAAYVNTDRPFSIKNIALFKPDPAKINGRYLYYLVISPTFQGLAKSARTGSAQPFLSLGILRGHPVSFHEAISDQVRIASILGAYDDLIEVNRCRIELLEEMARRLFEEWFVHFRFPGHERCPKVETQGGLLPEGWHFCPLEEMLVLHRGFDLPASARLAGAFPVVAATGVHGTHSEARVKGPGLVTGRSGTIGTVLLIHEDQ
jgi:type I restriction enzyme S subunit